MQVNMNTSGTDILNGNQDKTNDILGKDDFLKLLISQLQNQNPLDPVDDKEFIAQMAQFSSLEQINNMNETIESMSSSINENFEELINKMSDMNSINNKLNNVSLIGKKVSYEDENGEIDNGIVTGVYLKDSQKIVVDNDTKITLNDIKHVEENPDSSKEDEGDQNDE